MKKCKFPLTAQVVRRARLESGLEQLQFIEQHKLNITQATFSRWETGQIQAPTEVLLQIGVLKSIY